LSKLNRFYFKKNNFSGIMILTKQARQSPVKSGNASPYRKNRQSPPPPAMRENAENNKKTTSNNLTT
jgi:hypothetical protein